MSWFDSLKTKFNSLKNLKYAKMFSGQTPIFSQFGNDVYASDVIQQCMWCICDEMSKLRLNHIVKKDGKELIANTKLNRLFEYGVNEYMTTSDFLSKITYMLLKNRNVFIYPKFAYYENKKGEVKKREVEGLYPLDPKKVEFLRDGNDRLFVRLYFRSGDDFTLPYDGIIHWRMMFSENEYMGGDYYGMAEVEDLLKTVQINDALLQSVALAAQKSLTITGLLKYPITVDEEAVKKDVARFEKALNESKSGILGLDAKSEYTQMKIDPKLVDKDTLEFVDNKILRHWGCSLPMLNGTATPSEHQAFYQKAIEPKVVSLTQIMTKVLFTPFEFSNGNRVLAYPEELIFLNQEQKIEVAKIVGDRGAFTNNQLLRIFGMPPYEGGDVRYMSLNYCNVNIADQYQLNRAGANKGGEEIGNQQE
ncbi:MAG: phage portal protein [Lachnospiraceae bacterium]